MQGNYVGRGQFLKLTYKADPDWDFTERWPKLIFIGSTFEDNMSPTTTAIYNAGYFPELEILILNGSKFINNYGSVTNDIYASKIK